MKVDPQEIQKQLFEATLQNFRDWLLERIQVELDAGRINYKDDALMLLLFEVYQRGAADACEQMHEMFRIYR